MSSSNNSNNGGITAPNPVSHQHTPTIPISMSLNASGGAGGPMAQAGGTFILNPSNNLTNTAHQTSGGHQQLGTPNLGQGTGAGVQTTQMINTSQINQMIAASSLISNQQHSTATRQSFSPQTSTLPQAPVMVKSEISNSTVGSNNVCFVNNNTSSATSTSSSTMVHPSPSICSPSASSCKSSNNLASTNENNQENESTKNNNKQEKINLNDLNKPATTARVGLPAPPPVVALDRQRLQELVQQVDPNEQLEEEVEDVLLSLADDFIESLISQACMIAKHRKSGHLDVKDVQLALDINWNMWIPGFGVDGVVGVFSNTGTSSSFAAQQQIGQQPSATAGSSSSATMMNRAPKKCLTTEAHKQRLALIKKVMKKI